MRRWRNCHCHGHFAAAAVLFALAALTAGCSSSSAVFGSSTTEAPQSSQQQSFSDRFSQLFSGGSSQVAAATPAAPAELSSCPVVDVRQGASTLSVGSGTDASAMQLRYQGTIGQTARECSLVAGNMVVKVGVQGRVILGPEGGAGTIEVPLRYALVQEGPEPKTIWTKLYRFPVVIGEGQSSVGFTHVEEDMIVPRPKAADLESYVVYIGFDTLAAKPQPAKPQKPAKKR